MDIYELYNGPQENSIILDIRNENELLEFKLKENFIHVPLPQLEPNAFINKHCDDEPKIRILCRSGYRAIAAREMFIKAGYDNVIIIQGGLLNIDTKYIEFPKQQA
jgi:rhodanese-related sulfurtransferase